MVLMKTFFCFYIFFRFLYHMNLLFVIYSLHPIIFAHLSFRKNPIIFGYLHTLVLEARTPTHKEDGKTTKALFSSEK
jgi:hypothetical protein